MMADGEEKKPFELMDCALITTATGRRAMNLRELRDRIMEVQESSLYYHFFENLLRPSFDDPEFRNDFALWAKRGLHDTMLAEKLGTVNPLTCCTLDDLRQTLVDVIEDHLAEREYVPWAKPDQEFHFLTSRLVIFDTRKRLRTVEELARAVPLMSTGSIYYHFIEARRRRVLAEDDFTGWLSQWGDGTGDLRRELGMVDYYYWTLLELRDRITQLFAQVLDDGD